MPKISKSKNTTYLSVFSANAGRSGPEQLRIRALFTQRFFLQYCHGINMNRKKDNDFHI